VTSPHHVAAVAGTLVLAACGVPAEEPAAVIPVVTVQEPAVSVGVEDGPAAEMFSGAYSALLLSDGTLAVADNGSHQIRLFDSAGGHLTSLGRAGRGPGEFSSYLTLFTDPHGRLSVFDAGTQRVTSYSADWTPASTTYVAEESNVGAGAPGPTWLYRNVMVTGPIHPVERAPVSRTLDRIGPGFHVVLLGPGACLWLAAAGPTISTWDLRGPDGARLETLVLPDDARLLQVTRDRVLLRRVDDLGVVRFTVHRHAVPEECQAAGAGAGDEAPSPAPAVSGGTVPERFIPDVMMAQERHYGDHRRYAADAAALDLPAANYQTIVLVGDSQGYFVIAAIDDYVCGLAVGYATPAFWGEAIPYCS
jgi:hypothetical protein